MTLTKLSLLLFYERLFFFFSGSSNDAGGRRRIGRFFFSSSSSWITRGCMALTLGFWLVNTLVFFAGCRPLSYFWDRYACPDTTGAMDDATVAGTTGTCVQTLEYNLWIGVCDVIIDVLVLLVPIPRCKSRYFLGA